MSKTELPSTAGGGRNDMCAPCVLLKSPRKLGRHVVKLALGAALNALLLVLWSPYARQCNDGVAVEREWWISLITWVLTASFVVTLVYMMVMAVTCVFYKMTGLVLDESGIILRQGLEGGPSSFAWEELSEFVPKGSEGVVSELVENFQKWDDGGGGIFQVKDIAGFNGEELAQLLNRWRVRSLAVKE